MKLWKVLARNSRIYNSNNKDKHNHNNSGIMMMEMYDRCNKSRSPTLSDDSGKHSSGSLQDPQALLLTTVHLQKKRSDEDLGIVLAPGNSELDPCPSIASLRPGSIAFTSEQLTPGDRICSVNGINTSRMRPEDVTNLLDNVDGSATLDIQYSYPNYASQSSLCLTAKVAEITVERIDGSLGITLRGGALPDHPHPNRPFVITQIRPNGPADKCGLIRVGDRLLKVDHYPLVNKTLLEAQQLLKENSKNPTKLTIEYDVSIMESVKYASGPLLVEIDRRLDEDFGLVVTSSCEGYFIEDIVPASTADRCGALTTGDQILAIDDLVLDEWNGSVDEVEMLLRRATKLQILPFYMVQRTRNYIQGQLANSLTGFSTINSKRSRSRNRIHRQSTFHKSIDSDYGSNCCACTGNMGVCHPETLTLTLSADGVGQGYGLVVSVGEHSENRSADILISRIVPDSPSYGCGCLQVGDRIISVNHQPNLTLQEINSILDLGTDPSASIILEIEFDVADTIVPSSGIFTVKLPRRHQGLGITITASKMRPDEPFIISEIRRGSIAHRIGSLHAGDRLLAIDNRPLDHLSLESAFEILQSSTNDIVTLKIEKTETDNSNLFLDSIVYTVELHRYGGPLGITISGSEDSMEPIVLSKLTEGGLAEKTGALHIGDRILAINGDNLSNRPLSEAIRLLQTSGDRVQLKIARKNASPAVLSVDSAIHSWNSNATTAPENEASSEESYPEQESLLRQQNKNKHDSQLQFYSDTEDTFCPSPLPLPNYNFVNTGHHHHHRIQGTYSNESILDNELFYVTLYKDSIYDDYGFSVSDGLYEKGVYINRIRKGGPADIVGLLKPYDRIIQVNDTKTKDFDCCLTVPLIASAGDRIELVIARNPYINFTERDPHDNISKKSFSASQNTITKTL